MRIFTARMRCTLSSIRSMVISPAANAFLIADTAASRSGGSKRISAPAFRAATHSWPFLYTEVIACILHDGPKKSDTIHTGIRGTAPDAAGYLFVPGDQPLIRPSSLRRMAEHFLSFPDRAVRLGYRDIPGSPVLFPAACRGDLLAYDGEQGGKEVIRRKRIPCDLVQAEAAWELWDVDTPEKMEQVRRVFLSETGRAISAEGNDR